MYHVRAQHPVFTEWTGQPVNWQVEPIILPATVSYFRLLCFYRRADHGSRLFSWSTLLHIDCYTVDCKLETFYCLTSLPQTQVLMINCLSSHQAAACNWLPQLGLYKTSSEYVHRLCRLRNQERFNIKVLINKKSPPTVTIKLCHTDNWYVLQANL